MKDALMISGAEKIIGAIAGSFQSKTLTQPGTVVLKETLKKAGLRPLAGEAISLIKIEKEVRQ